MKKIFVRRNPNIAYVEISHLFVNESKYEKEIRFCSTKIVSLSSVIFLNRRTSQRRLINLFLIGGTNLTGCR